MNGISQGFSGGKVGNVHWVRMEVVGPVQRLYQQSDE